MGLPSERGSGVTLIRGDLGRRVITKTRTLGLAMLVVMPIVLTGFFVWIAFHSANTSAVDFHHEFWPAARRLLGGHSPYDRSWQDISGGIAFPYPALTAVAFLPFAAMPLAVAQLIFTAVTLMALVLTLKILGVRDWRIYCGVLLWAPVVAAWQSANVTLLLGLGLACLWRQRSRSPVVGLIVAVLVSIKPFMWPVALWLVATHRWRACAWAAGGALVVNTCAWAFVGVSQIDAYHRLVQAVTAVMSHRGYSIVNLASRIGLGHELAYLVMVATTAVVLGACLWAGRRRDGAPALTLSIAACLCATPVLWTHYLALLIVPLAIEYRRLRPVWWLPLILWLCPSSRPTTGEIGLALAVTGIITLFAVQPGRLHLRAVGAARAAFAEP